MDTVSHFKFACPVCGQHLQAQAEEEGRTTECPSCFKKLTVPRAPAPGGGKLIITASLAEPRKVPVREAAPTGASARRVSLADPTTWLMVAVVLSILVAAGLFLAKLTSRSSEPVDDAGPQLWTDDLGKLMLLDAPAVGRLNGWEFALTSAIWRDTRLVLRQDGGQPAALRLSVTFPLRGGELVPGKTYKLGRDDPPFETPIQMVWKDESGRDHYKPISSGYVLWVKFDDVSPDTVSGRLHICLPDATESWVAGSFDAENKTQIN